MDEVKFAIDPQPRHSYDPAKVKELLKKAGAENTEIPLSVGDAAFTGAVDAALIWEQNAKEAGLRANAVEAGDDFTRRMVAFFADYDAQCNREGVADFAELLLWCHAPELALEITRRQRDDRSLRSAVAQRDVLGIELADLQLALMKAWKLPELLVRLGDVRHAGQVQVRNVLLAVRVARHTATGWDNAALPDDIADIGALLQLGPAPTMALLRGIDS